MIEGPRNEIGREGSLAQVLAFGSVVDMLIVGPKIILFTTDTRAPLGTADFALDGNLVGALFHNRSPPIDLQELAKSPELRLSNVPAFARTETAALPCYGHVVEVQIPCKPYPQPVNVDQSSPGGEASLQPDGSTQQVSCEPKPELKDSSDPSVILSSPANPPPVDVDQSSPRGEAPLQPPIGCTQQVPSGPTPKLKESSTHPNPPVGLKPASPPPPSVDPQARHEGSPPDPVRQTLVQPAIGFIPIPIWFFPIYQPQQALDLYMALLAHRDHLRMKYNENLMNVPPGTVAIHPTFYNPWLGV